MTDAEKKAAALPPKLTVPMILFFLPVLFAVIIGPAAIQVMHNGPQTAIASVARSPRPARSAWERRAEALGSVRGALLRSPGLQLLPAVLLGQHLLEIGDIGRRLVGRQVGAGDLLGLVEAALQADDQREVLAHAAVGAGQRGGLRAGRFSASSSSPVST